jgi:hypothetical protein
VLFVLCAAWAVATPLGAAPDEPAQIVKAAATVRGELIGQPAPGQPAAVREFRVPAVFNSVYNLPICFQFHPQTPAGCAPHVPSSGTIVTSTSYVGRYPPLYYALVGLPTLAMHSENVIYFMRLISALMDALLLSLALTIATFWCRSTMMLGAIALTISPMVIFLAGVVNPSGFEIAAAICVWTSGLALVRNGALPPSRRVVTTFAISSCLLELTRGLSPLWMGLIAATLFCLEPRACVQLLRHWSVRIGVAIVGVVGAIAIWFIIVAKTLDILPSIAYPPHHGSLVTVTEQVLGLMGGYGRQLIGVFGWLDTPSPLLTIVLWSNLVGLLLALAILVSKRHDSVVLVGLIGGSFLLTMVLIESNAASSGITWQGRDGFPLYAGIPLVAGIAIANTSILSRATIRRLAVLVASGVGVCQLTDYIWTLRRYTVGLGRTINLLQPVRHGWSPPLGTPVMLSLGIAAVALYTVYLFIQMRN